MGFEVYMLKSYDACGDMGQLQCSVPIRSLSLWTFKKDQSDQGPKWM